VGQLKGIYMNGSHTWFNLVNFYLELDDLVQPLLSPEQNEEYEKLRRLMSLHVDFLREGIEEFSWEIAHKKGWLSRHDYEKRFVEELKGFDWRNWKPEEDEKEKL
jgi:hypothetical protein